MRIVGLTPGQVDAALRAVAAVLNLGNVGFSPGAAADEATLAGPDDRAALEASLDEYASRQRRYGGR